MVNYQLPKKREGLLFSLYIGGARGSPLFKDIT